MVLFVRLAIGLLFVSAWAFTAASGKCAEQNIDQKIAERTKQYQESLRQRASQVSPAFQSKIEAQAQKTVAQGLKIWKKGELDMRIALPRWADTQRIVQFVSRHFSGSDTPDGAWGFGTSMLAVAVNVTPVQCVVKSFTIPVADFVLGYAGRLFRLDGNNLSYFIRVVAAIVQRQ